MTSHHERYYESVRAKMTDARNSWSGSPGRQDTTRPRFIGHVFDPAGLLRPRRVSTFSGLITVLIVDDSEDQLHLLRRHFELAGCQVIVASTAEEAIEAYENLDLDLAVVDLVLPGMTGWDFTNLLQSDHPNTPVAISSVLDFEDYPTTEASLPKPVSRDSVRQVLSNCVPRWVAP